MTAAPADENQSQALQALSHTTWVSKTINIFGSYTIECSYIIKLICDARLPHLTHRDADIVHTGSEAMTKTVTDVICPFCGTLCDDLEVEVSDDGKTIVDIYNACAIGAEKLNKRLEELMPQKQ
jgi:hypothetical protein